ncbi:MAG: hypothetical protein AB7K09_01360 [Planctomycetota bacterium]
MGERDEVRRRGCLVRLVLLPFTTIALVWPLAFYWYQGTLGDVRGFLRNHGMGVGGATIVTLLALLLFHHLAVKRYRRWKRGGYRLSRDDDDDDDDE